MAKLGKFAPIIIGLLFVLSATIHRMSLGSPGYTTSPLVSVNIFGMLLMLIMIVGLMITTAKYTALNLLGVFVLVIAGMIIDAPTIVYAT